MDPQIKAIQEAVGKPDTVLQVSIAFNLSGEGPSSYWGVTVLGPRKKKLSPFIVVSEGYPNTPAGALRSLADLLEATG